MTNTPPKGQPRRSKAAWLLAASALLALAACKPSSSDSVGAGASGASAVAAVHFNAVDITGAAYAKQLSLKDVDGKVRSLEEFKGKVVFLFFGYTQCPDVCPTSMAELAEIKKSLGADGDRLQGIFITVDPQRDTPALLKAYMANFDPSFLALVPTPEQLATVAKDFKVYYKKVDGSTPTSYTMDHSAGSYVYDTQGRLRLYARYGGGAAPLLGDLKLLLKQA
jgi:protein SCO1/2